MRSIKREHSFKTGIYSWFGFDLPLRKRLNLIKEAGFEATTLWWGDQVAFRDEKKENIPFLVREQGLYLENIHIPYQNCWDLWSPDPFERKKILYSYRGWLEDCARFDIPMLVMHLTNGSRGPGPNRQGLEALGDLIERAEELGVMLAVENTGNREYLQAMFSEYDSPALGFCYDSSHDRLNGSNRLKVLNRWGDRLKAVHLSDNDGREDRHWLPGRGIIDWQEVGAVFPDNYEGCMTLEVMTPELRDPVLFLHRAQGELVRIGNMLLEMRQKSGCSGKQTGV